MGIIPIGLRKGDDVIHKLTGEVMRIKRIGKIVAVCRIPPIKYDTYTVDVRICLVESLIKI